MIYNEIIKYAQGLNASEDVFLWLERRNKQGKLIDQQEVEHIIDFFLSDKAPKRFVRMSYKNAKQKAHDWVEVMNKKGAEIEEGQEDTEVVLDFGDGFKFVRLIGENAYKREGVLMRHCVASYYGRDVEVYSLRDAKNRPHCTIEKDIQIKGKGNGSICPKYIDYVIRFLEWTGMRIRPSEMANLGYKDANGIQEYIENELYRGRYAYGEFKPKQNVTICTKKEELIGAKGVILFLGYLNLRTYNHPLPEGFTYCGGTLDIEDYNYPLPEGFTHCEGALHLRTYNHPIS